MISFVHVKIVSRTSNFVSEPEIIVTANDENQSAHAHLSVTNPGLFPRTQLIATTTTFFIFAFSPLLIHSFLLQPLQLRELAPEKSKKPNTIGVYTNDPAQTSALIREAQLLEYGRAVARDIGSADPERMAPKRIEQYITSLFKDTPVKVTVISDEQELVKGYPLFAAVNRAASGVERHQGRVVFLEYAPDPKKIEKTLFLVGKGVTYDTGGADIKAGGVMAGMSRDKCGAAAVVGFLALVARLQPQNLRIVGGVSLVRNSVGSNCYVSDELIVSRAGIRVRIGNTDAEGRMVMTDVLARVSIVYCLPERFFNDAHTYTKSCYSQQKTMTITMTITMTQLYLSISKTPVESVGLCLLFPRG